MDAQIHEGAIARRHIPHYLETLPKTVVILADESTHAIASRTAKIFHEGVLDWIRDVAGEDWLHVSAFGFKGISKTDLPRGQKWRDYPTIREPLVKSTRGTGVDGVEVLISKAGRAESVYGIDRSAALGAAETIVITMIEDSKVDFDAEREGKLLARIWGFISQALDVGTARLRKVVVIRTGRSPQSMSLEEFRDMAAGYIPYLRFDYNYRVNASVILGELLRYLVPKDFTVPDTVGWNLNHAERSKLGNTPPEVLSKGYVGAMASPLALQLLFRLRREHSVPDAFYASQGRWTDGCVREDVISKALIGDERNWRNEPLWKGTGRHDPKPLDTVSVAYALETFLFFGLAAPNEDNAYELTDVGGMFLNLMHQDNEDADVLLRWRGPADAKTGAAMDDWILRNFRKMKHKIRKTRPALNDYLEEWHGP